MTKPSPIEKAIALFNQGDKIKALGIIAKLNIRKCLTKEQHKTIQIAFEMNTVGDNFYRQLGYVKSDMFALACAYFERTFIYEKAPA